MTTTTRSAVLTDQSTGRVPERLLDAALVRQAALDQIVAGDINTPSSAIATALQAIVGAAVAAVVNGAPGALDTLKELATALANDPTYAADITAQLAAKAPLASPTFTGTVGGITAGMVGADPAGAAATAQGASLQKTSNLSDIASPPTARTNLGLGTAATQPATAFDAAGAATTAAAAAAAAAQAAAATDASTKDTALVASLAATYSTKDDAAGLALLASLGVF